MTTKQIKEVAKSTAELIHNTTCWEEPIDGDYAEIFCEEFTKHFNELNGNN